ncbi:MAG: polysulfide reductase NrfD [Thermoleophilia bacterium]|nr:polysulfide reductase NrfD [Thermoleophilia bacterium]
MADDARSGARGGHDPGSPSPEETARRLEAAGVRTTPAATEAELARLDRALDDQVFRSMSAISLRFVLVVLFLGGVVTLGAFAFGWQIYRGIGVTGLNRPVFWGFYITSFVFWIGISHSGTLVSAILRVLKVEWRRPLTRAAEAMTVFALMIGGLFPIIHLGRNWRFYWMIPIPNDRGLWPNFRSALMWDLLAILTYITASSLFLYFPLVPDLAAARDRSRGIRHKVYAVLSLGWRGTQQQWHRLHLGMRIFTVIVIPIAVSVHSIVSWDFGMTLVEGWRSTIFAPYFVIGAIYSGVAALISVLIVLRKATHLEDYLTVRHIDRMGKVLLAVAVIWFYFFWSGYLTDWYGGNAVARALQDLHTVGAMAPLFWAMIVVNMAVPFLFLWWRRVRTNMAAMLAISLLVNVGMWIERFLIVVTSPMRNSLSFDWGGYRPGWPEIAIVSATFAAFALLYVIFSKLLPLISTWEVKEGWRIDRWQREGVVELETDVPTLSEPGGAR